MADPFIGEIRAVAFNYAPEGWALCNGQLLQTNAYQALYALLANTFGGTPQSGQFGVPDLQGRSILGVGTGLNLPPTVWGTKSGQAQLQLSQGQMPQHTHTAQVVDPGHTHNAGLPAHTHSTSIPANTAGTDVTLTSPAEPSYAATSAGIDGNFTNLISQLSGVAAITPLPPTPLYAATSNGTMSTGNTGPATATGVSATGASTTGVQVNVQPAGGITPISTQSPALGLYYIIATMGIWPPRQG